MKGDDSMKLIDVLENLELDVELFDMEVKDDFKEVTLELFEKDIEKTIDLKHKFEKAINNVFRRKNVPDSVFTYNERILIMLICLLTEEA